MKIEMRVLNEEFYKVKKLGGEYYDTPVYETQGAAAIDLRSTESLVLKPGDVRVIGTGLAIYIKEPSVVGVIAPRSGAGTRGLVLANTVGIIDSDYQGEIKIAAYNRNNASSRNNENSIIIEAGDRIAQLMFLPVLHCKFDIVKDFTQKSYRGEGGFGSTGES